MDGSKADGDLVMIQTFLLYYVNQVILMLTSIFGPVELDKSSQWMDWFSLDSVILIIVTGNCLPFSYSRSIFRRHIS